MHSQFGVDKFQYCFFIVASGSSAFTDEPMKTFLK